MPVNVGGYEITKEMGDHYSRLSVAGNYVTDGLVLYLDAGVPASYYGYWSPSLSNGANAFDGNLSTAAGILGGTTGPFTYTFTNPPTVTSARMYVTFGASSSQVGSTTNIFLVNGIDVTQKAKDANLYDPNAGWIDVTEEVGGTWNTFQFRTLSGITNAGIFAIEINNEILIGNYDGTTWNDLSGNGTNGTLTNGPIYSSADGGIIDFDGTNDYINMGTFNLQRDFTLETWVNMDDDTSFALFGQGPTAVNQGLHILYQSGSRGMIYGMYANDNDYQNNYRPTTGVWYHWVFTYSHSTYNKEFYADGVLQTPGSSVENAYAGSGQFNLGAIYSSPLGYSNGKFSSFKVYDRVLSATEITQNFNALRNRFGV